MPFSSTQLVPSRLQLLDSQPPPTPISSSTSSPLIFDTSLSASPAHSMVIHAKIGIHKPNPKYTSHVLVLSSTNGTVDPTSFSLAHKHKEWCLAMVDKFNALFHPRTWNLVPRTSL
ncbi:unnamed protein product [Prunus armeniaca]|uniref:Reverse transcriptase Ty1/copia-type domain-containing protein n=1 Tax=Prunus armeniaca TaxID=36596 RepID=A0A6J5UNP7_PRUAR|nr:unnamed protein product [Prunus armeniaca]